MISEHSALKRLLRYSILLGIIIVLMPRNAANAQQFSEAIEDNSFFIEEAYNQEPRVVQHITNTIYTMNPGHEFMFTFTQEWPVTTETHQLSYTLPYLSLNSNVNRGIGDMVLNYRYQLSTKASWAAISPRISLLLPTGKSENGLGSGVLGLQVNIPASKRLTDQFIIHGNAGGMLLPAAKGTKATGEEVKRTLVSLSFGISGIWLAERYNNILLECLYTLESSIDNNGDIARESFVLINPAYRRAIEVGDLEIVPGIGFPVTLSRSTTDFGIFVYLSFEHPF